MTSAMRLLTLIGATSVLALALLIVQTTNKPAQTVDQAAQSTFAPEQPHTAQPTEPPEPAQPASSLQAANAITLTGRVEIKGRYEVVSQSQRTPLDIVIALDASGSMNWNYDGYGTLSQASYNRGLWQFQPENERGVGKPINCGAPEVLALPAGCQSNDAWSTYQERRIYRAKQLARQFLEQYPWLPTDRAAVVTFNGGSANGQPPADPLAGLTRVYPEQGLTSNITGGPGSLVDVLINQAASKNPGSSNPEQLYTTIGASPGALGMRRARNALALAPDTGVRERYVILLSDGAFDVNLAGVRSPTGLPEDNVGEGKPITQAINEADLIKTDEQHPAAIFVLALRETSDDTDLRDMASGRRAPFYLEADDPDAVHNIMSNIGNQVIDQTCDPREEEWQTPDVSRATDEAGAPLGYVGGLQVRDANGNLVAVTHILADGTWRVPNLQPNTSYTLEFTIYYRGLDDIVRRYNNIYYLGNEQFTHNSLATLPTLTVTLPDTGLAYTFALPDPVLITMPLNTEVCIGEPGQPSPTTGATVTATATGTSAPSEAATATATSTATPIATSTVAPTAETAATPTKAASSTNRPYTALLPFVSQP